MPVLAMHKAIAAPQSWRLAPLMAPPTGSSASSRRRHRRHLRSVGASLLRMIRPPPVPRDVLLAYRHRLAVVPAHALRHHRLDAPVAVCAARRGPQLQIPPGPVDDTPCRPRLPREHQLPEALPDASARAAFSAPRVSESTCSTPAAPIPTATWIWAPPSSGTPTTPKLNLAEVFKLHDAAGKQFPDGAPARTLQLWVHSSSNLTYDASRFVVNYWCNGGCVLEDDIVRFRRGVG